MQGIEIKLFPSSFVDDNNLIRSLIFIHILQNIHHSMKISGLLICVLQYWSMS